MGNIVWGLCIFLDISQDTWEDYKKREDFIGITTRVEGIIYSQKLEGAAADLLNSNIIARELGLSDKKELDLSNPDGSLAPKTIDASKLSTDALRELASVMNEHSTEADEG